MPFLIFNNVLVALEYGSQTTRACDISAGYINDAVYLTLEDIHAADDLISVNPRLSNRFVRHRFATPFETETGLWSVEMLRSLGIVNCPRISVWAPKELAENRIVEATARGSGTDAQDDDFDDITPIQTLHFSGCGFNLSEEDWRR